MPEDTELKLATTALERAVTRAQEASRGELGKLVVVANTKCTTCFNQNDPFSTEG